MKGGGRTWLTSTSVIWKKQKGNEGSALRFVFIYVCLFWYPHMGTCGEEEKAADLPGAGVRGS